jgi:hypothetical protein
MTTKHQIEIDSSQLLKLKELAIKNGIKPNAQNCINMAIEIAIDCATYLQEDDFQQVTSKVK